MLLMLFADGAPVSNSVVITRPLAQSDSLARRVAAIGRDAIIFPLLEIHPLPDPAQLKEILSDIAGYAMVAFVSPNAIHATFSFLQEWPRDVALAVMGEGSRVALAQHGLNSANATILSPLDAHRTDSQTLLAALDLAALKGKRVLIIRGESGLELLADGLSAAGVHVTQVAAYRRVEPSLSQALRQQLLKLLEGRHDWVLTSSESLRHLLQMVEKVADVAGVAKMQQQRIIVPHARIAETARTLGFGNITLTGSGDEQLLAALQSSA
jgi:uroporphyrinogen-III synthase